MSASPIAVFQRLSAPRAPTETPVLFGTVHVLGAGIGGLLAARILSDHAERVVAIEPEGGEGGIGGAPRPGVPQGSQLHTVMPGGVRQLERWYPGVTAQAEARGAVLPDPNRSASYLDGVEQVSTPNVNLLLCGRPLLETLIRERTLRLPNVQTAVGRVSGLVYEGERVAAVRYSTSAGESVQASDFVVDATGRGSRIADWLEAGDYPRPRLERLDVDVRYVTGHFQRSPDWTGPLSGIARFSPQAASARFAGAAVNAVEGRRWAVMLASYGDDPQVLDAEGFQARCEALPPVYQEAVRGRLVGGLVPFRHPDNRWRHFEALDRFPARLVVMGDAVASFNPVYGQGMSSAMLHASCLSEYLRGEPDLDTSARHFFELQRVVVAAAWQTSTAADTARLGLVGPPSSPEQQRTAWAMRHIMAAAIHDSEVAAAFRDVTFMLSHPATLLAPDLVRRAARANGVPDAEYDRAYGPVGNQM
ncbi:NAD(P)/FAD-dependent oxidoreductase [Streptomyces sp. VRA16 Mangrove soil]|uniref:FAD-dependent oxidoreductase n=1 Tax=Streptomyces sp. VRA16 Mangrove soil TaxID=2817434 RepID=UPI001A9F3D65|nr:FAD-binding monooxygenase [Streptomyces sp. VRA16 Mangrove soil]MBO1334335.1 FAD-binding monooxygenase [Streptomyces sp. VRA16 Mangrove soil]